MTVVVAPNIKKTAVRIDLNGNEIDPATKRIIKKNEPDYVPSALSPEPKKKSKKVETTDNPFADVFKEMLQEEMKTGLKQAMAGLDLKQMMGDVLKDAFKK